jgi:hypothetical protein
MKTFYYTFSAELRKTLEDIESARSSLLLHPLMPKMELELRFGALLERLYFHELLRNQHVSREQITSLFYPQPRLKFSVDEAEIVNYKKALDYISFEWTANRAAVDIKTVVHIASLLELPAQTVERMKEDLHQGLRYIQVHPESPITQAAVAHMLIEDLFPAHSRYLPYLISLLFLYKGGYDFKGLLVLEKYLFQDKETYGAIAKDSLKTFNLSQWIEFFAKKVLENVNEMTTVMKKVTDQPASTQSMFDLTDRQKQILSYLQKPGVSITNRKVQELFQVSQITASRDLAKLTALGLLFSIGAGRSTYYTRV